MKPLQRRIEHTARVGRLPQPVIEKDYALSYLLAGVARRSLPQLLTWM